MTTVRSLAATACALAVLIGAGEEASAQSQVCVDLQARLVALEQGAGNRQGFQEHDQSVRQQEREIDRATAESRRRGCNNIFSAQRRTPACIQLEQTIRRMRSNLRQLVVARNRYTDDPRAIARQRTEIERAMSINRCHGATVARRAPSVGGLFANLFGTARGFGESRFFRGGLGGTHRTLCVRACDGYYFPISFSTVAQRFSQDAQICRARCPGAEVALYTHRNPGGSVDTMVSLAGQPYAALPTAFKYRQEYDPACGCGTPVAQPSTALNATFDIRPAQPVVPAVPLPLPRPDRFEDPETLANRAGGLRLGPPAGAGEAVVAAFDADGIRIVGPTVFFGEETDIQALTPSRGGIFRRPPLRN